MDFSGLLNQLKNLSREEMIMYGLAALNAILILIILFRHRSESYESTKSVDEIMTEQKVQHDLLVQAILKKAAAQRAQEEATQAASVAKAAGVTKI